MMKKNSQKQTEWKSFFSELPEYGQTIFYYGQCIGVWVGRYEWHPNDPVSPHLIFSEGGVVDRMDAPWWMPCEEHMWKPEKPSTDYPADYPK
jgi:hypothetical protein